MREQTPARRAARFILVFTALFLPMATLVPLGGLYLWEKGWVLWWTLGALAVVSTTVALQRWWLDVPGKKAAIKERIASELRHDRNDPVSPLEQRAWEDVQAIARSVAVDELVSLQSLLELGQRTVDAVARRLHAEKKDALWQFTLPEALAITEQVSARLGVLVDSSIPFGERLTVAQVIAVYRWRHLVDVAERAYDVWRLVRLINPATALTAEARERMSRAVLQWGREHIARRFASAFVEEVGRAAIDLYSGRLKSGVAGHRLLAAEAEAREELRVTSLTLLAIGSAADRDAVALAVDRLLALRAADDATAVAYETKLSDAVAADGFGRRQLLRASADADVILWIVGPPGVPTSGDLEAREELRRHFVASPRLLPPAVVVVACGGPETASSELAPLREPLDLSNGGVGAPLAPAICIETTPELSSEDTARVAHAVISLEQRSRHVKVLRRRIDQRGPGLLAVGSKAVTAAGSIASMLWRSGGGSGPRTGS